MLQPRSETAGVSATAGTSGSSATVLIMSQSSTDALAADRSQVCSALLELDSLPLLYLPSLLHFCLTLQCRLRRRRAVTTETIALKVQ